MARARIADAVGEAAVLAAIAETAADTPSDAGAKPDRNTVATAVRYLLQLLAENAEGNTVEVRVPPFGAVQCIEGPRHTRGTPPNVIETDPSTWIALATGRVGWADALGSGAVHASGQRADLTGHVPVLPLPGPAHPVRHSAF